MATAPPVVNLLGVSLEDLTQATLDGRGVFDVLMRANKAHLDQEFSKGRIKGPEYATVYLGTLEHVLQASVTFLLEKDKSAAEIALLEKQIQLAEVNVRKALAELDILQQGLPKIQAEIAVLQAQECKLRAEYDLTGQTTLKTAEETALLGWKTATEKAQTSGAGVDEDSVIGRQKRLYQAQTDGFQRDAEQKAAKVLVDAWNVQRTTDSTGIHGTPHNKLDEASIGRAVGKLLSGVGA